MGIFGPKTPFSSLLRGEAKWGFFGPRNPLFQEMGIRAPGGIPIQGNKNTQNQKSRSQHQRSLWTNRGLKTHWSKGSEANLGEKLKGRSLKGSFDKACALTCRFLCRSPPHPPTLPTPFPLFPYFHRENPPPTTPCTRPRTPPPGTPIRTRTPLRKLPPVKTTL